MNFYRQAASILDDLNTKKQGSLKSLVFNSTSQQSPANQKRLFALLSETLKQKELLEKIIESSQLLKLERKARISWNLALVLVHDLVCTKQGIGAANGPIKEAILRHKTRLKSEYVRAQLSRKDKVEKIEVSLPRWVRVNTLKLPFQSFLQNLSSKSFLEVASFSALEDTKKGYMIDLHVPNLLAFNRSYPVTTTFSHEYSTGQIILQDKASCIPASLLDVQRGDVVLDACAAPGNKTTQLAAGVGKEGRVFAIERDEKRTVVLRDMVEKAGAEKFTTILNADFTSLSPDDSQFAKVTSILLDPSCSGSGLLRLEDNNTSSSHSSLQTRLRNLSTFQQRLLKHALSFPSVEKVVYSTCSIHAEENEYVVRAVLEETQGWRVIKREEQTRGIREWERRGWRVEGVGEEISEGCVRCEKGTDGTIGFFAVGFVRTDGMSHEKGTQTKESDDEDDNDNNGDDGDEEEWQGIPS